jgi:P27 family predicted phage terminase small subunit
MGSRGPLPKDEGARQNRRSRSNLRLIETWDEQRPIPDTPEGMSDRQLETWRAYFESPLSALIKETDLPVVRRLWGYYQQHEELTNIFDRGRLVPGSTGQPRINPAHAALMQLDSAIHRLENELGLTPTARLRLGITFADATTSLEKLTERAISDVTDDDDLWADS